MKLNFEIKNREDLNELKRIIQYYEYRKRQKERELNEEYMKKIKEGMDDRPLSIERCNF